MYFEFNLPEKMPSYIDSIHAPAFNAILKTVSERMNRLEEALSYSTLSPDVFSYVLASVFDPEKEVNPIDVMEPGHIVELAEMLAVGVKVEPRIEWPNAEVVVDTAFVTRKEWETLRMLGTGGSDAAVILGISPYNTPRSLFYSKRGTQFAIPEPKDEGKDFIFEYGHRMEDMVINTFCKQEGCTRVRETRMFRSKKYPFMTANIDGIIRFPDDRLAVFEAKTTTSFNRDAWSNGSCPAHYVPQCRQYPMVLDDDRIKETYIGCIHGNTLSSFVSTVIPRDKAVEEQQAKHIEEYWNKYILGGVEPPLSANAIFDSEIHRRIIGYADKKTKKMPCVLEERVESNEVDDLIASAQEYRDIHEQRLQAETKVKNLKAREDIAAAPLKDAMGKNIKGKLSTNDGDFIVTWNPVSRTKLDTKKLQEDFPDAYEACASTEEESYRTFKVDFKEHK